MGNYRGNRNWSDDRRGGRRSFNDSRNSRNFRDRGSDRQMFKVVCSNCGRDCEVPFKPTNEKPVYCSDCFREKGGGQDKRSFDRPRRSDRNFSDDKYKIQLDSLNAKLDKILGILQTKEDVVADSSLKVVTEAPAEEIKTKSSKSKKTVKKSKTTNKE